MKTKTKTQTRIHKLPSTKREEKTVKTSRASPNRVLFGIKSILVPTDFSKQSEKALAYAIHFGRHFGAKISLLHVIEPIATPDFKASFPISIQKDQAKKFCEGALAKIVDEYEIEPEPIERKLVWYGRAFNEISHAARTLKATFSLRRTAGAG